jgi:hypothetical protein
MARRPVAAVDRILPLSGVMRRIIVSAEDRSELIAGLSSTESSSS